MLDIDILRECILKEYIDGSTIFQLVKSDNIKKIYIEQLKELAKLTKAQKLNIDYFPTNLVIQNGLFYYIDYECNNYKDE